MRIGVILAGGASTRMGENKALLCHQGRRLIDMVHSKIAPQCDDVIISGQSNYGLACQLVPDRDDGPGGPAAGIYSVWQRLRARPEPPKGFLTCPVDAPGIPPDLMARLAGDNSATAYDGERRHPTLSWWCLDDLDHVFSSLDMTKSVSLHGLANGCEARDILWDSPSLFDNINTPNDWRRYLTS